MFIFVNKILHIYFILNELLFTILFHSFPISTPLSQNEIVRNIFTPFVEFYNKCSCLKIRKIDPHIKFYLYRLLIRIRYTVSQECAKFLIRIESMHTS